MQIIAIVVSLGLTVAALAMLVPAVRQMLGVIRGGQAAPGRTSNPGARTLTMLKETLLHTRMLQWSMVGALHWFAFAAFIVLSTAVAQAYFQLFKVDFAWPLIGHWVVYEWAAELLGLLGALAIIPLSIYRQVKHPRSLGRQSRFFGSTQWQAYFVEAMVFLESAAILFIRGAEYKYVDGEAAHFPVSHLISGIFPDSPGALEGIIWFIAMLKIGSAMAWLMVIARNLTMGVAWHRFTAWFNIWFRRESDGSTALGAIKPLMSDGRAVTLDDIEDLDEDSTLGVGQVEDFSWKGLLDFTTCTECGRCQSQCPAWNTEKPLSPKLMMMGLREHAYAKATGDESHADRTLVGSGDKGEDHGAGTDVLDWFYNPDGGDFVIDEDVLWSCTSCGACVQQCPVDIEHVDHIMDMRRYQVLVEANFPAELNQLFKGLENKGNPWNMSASARMDWAKGLDFDVPVVGDSIESLEEVDWLFWVGCAGAYEDRAKKTTRAVAELLDTAGISFGVLGNGETCTGDPARRAGNEFVFQGLAQQNVETFKEYKVKKVVSTCAHCFNTLRNEYKDFGIELEVVHHTQLLNKLVREGKLTPVTDGAGAAQRSITYHDPCYLGRHNQVYSPPRELLDALPGAEYKEMDRHSEKSFCCGAGGARMWMEEKLGNRINVDRTQEAVGTGADQIAVGCPFCRVMLSDGLTAEQAKGEAREEVEVLDVAQMLLASVKGEQATRAAPGSSAKKAAAAGAAGAAAGAAGAATAVATRDEPAADGGGSSLFDSPGDAGPAAAEPAAKASGGGSLFDDGDSSSEASSGGGSLFDDGGGSSLFDTPAQSESAAPDQGTAGAGTAGAGAGAAAAGAGAAAAGGSLFDVGGDEPATPASGEPVPEPTTENQTEAPPEDPAPQPSQDLGAGGSLFDVPASEPAAPAAPAEQAEAGPPRMPWEEDPAPASGGTNSEPATETEAQAPAPAPPEESAAEPTPATSAAAPANEIPEEGSLFDISTPETPPASGGTAPEPATETETEAPPEEPEPATEPPSSGEANQPRTDSDIDGSGSLFDI